MLLPSSSREGSGCGGICVPSMRRRFLPAPVFGSTIRAAMGYLELFAQRTFAEETERITGGAAGWQDPPEIRYR
jgi:hypothetical protein